MRIINESEFNSTFTALLGALPNPDDFHAVTGPGRSGAIAAVYASHLLRLPFIPFGHPIPTHLRVLIVDTAQESGRTLRKALRRYAANNPFALTAYHEPPRVAFWYEACNPKPQHYRHEQIAA